MSDKPELPQLPDDDTNETRATEIGQTQPITPRHDDPPPTPQRPINRVPQRPPAHVRPVPKRGKARTRRDSGFYLPLWSLLLMLLMVVGITATVVVLVMSLGGNSAPAQSTPVIIVSSPVPTERPAGFPVVPATPTIPPQLDPNQPQPTVNFELSGPTLPPVVISPTPRTITIGENVIVTDVGAQQLNVRDVPGVTGSTVLFRAPEGAEFVIVEGPRQADGLTWWQIRSPLNETQVGWAASNYLEVASEN